MVKSWQRKAFYRLAGPLMWANGRIYRYFRAPKKGLRVQLGPGHDRYLKGWLNVDANIVTAKIDLWANLVNTLPFRCNSVKSLYCFSVLQHLPYFHVEPLLREIYYCLEVGGLARIAVLHAGNAAKAYVENRTDWFGTWPIAYESIGGKFENYCLVPEKFFVCLTTAFLRNCSRGPASAILSNACPLGQNIPMFSAKRSRWSMRVVQACPIM